MLPIMTPVFSILTNIFFGPAKAVNARQPGVGTQTNANEDINTQTLEQSRQKLAVLVKTPNAVIH